MLCTREIQKTLEESVYKLLAQQIELMGLGSYYEIQRAKIMGINGSEFVFAGLRDQVVNNIRSYEGIDRFWVEEGQYLTEQSLRILIPTMRKRGSQILLSFNPELETDPVWRRFIVDPPDEAIVVKMTWRDNPWFSEENRADMESDRVRLSGAEFNHIWEGKCLPAVEGAIFFNEVERSQSENRVTHCPYDPLLKAFPIFDLGYNDATAIVIAQRAHSSIRVIDYIEDNGKNLEWYSNQLKALGYNWGTMFLPHDGAAKDVRHGKSAQEIMTAFGWQVEIVPNWSVEEGIRQTRLKFPNVIFNQEKTGALIEHLKRYKRTKPKTGVPGRPMHDEHSHGADAFRYLSIVADSLRNESLDSKSLIYDDQVQIA